MIMFRRFLAGLASGCWLVLACGSVAAQMVDTQTRSKTGSVGSMGRQPTVTMPMRPAPIGLGTVLYSAHERALLEGHRPRAREQATESEQSEFRFDGYVRQAGQAPVLWLNGTASAAGDTVGFESERATVRINGRAAQRLAAGQSTGRPELGEGNTATVVVPGRTPPPVEPSWNLPSGSAERHR